MQNKLMKPMTTTVAALVMGASCVVAQADEKEPLRLSEPVVSTATTETFGQPLDNSLPSVELAVLKQTPQRYVDTAFSLTTKVAQVCQKKGCFFIAQQGDEMMRVSFRDYSFFVPTDSAQKEVTLNGSLVKRKLSKQQAEHYNKDLRSDNADIEPGVVYEIVADAVRVPKLAG